MGTKRKRVASQDRAASSPLSSVPGDTIGVQSSMSASRPRRREGQLCPICGEKVAPKMLDSHITMELSQLDTLQLPRQQTGNSRGRRQAAVRARKSLSALAPTPRTTTVLAADPTNLEGTLSLVRRNRHDRAARLREYGRSAYVIDENPPTLSQQCPICQQDVPGEEDVVQAHVDACLAHVRLQHEEEVEVDEYEWAGQRRVRMTAMSGFSGSGFHVLNRALEDVDDDLDVDGDEEAIYGEAQFGENDILAEDEPAGEQTASESEEGAAVEPSERSSIRRTLRDLVAEGRVVRPKLSAENEDAEEVISVGDAEELDCAVATAKETGSMAAIIDALQMKVKQLESMRVTPPNSSLLCRICLDPFDSPLVSIQCWHVHCRDCWMRSLGVSKLCPQCKCITLVSNLRRVYM